MDVTTLFLAFSLIGSRGILYLLIGLSILSVAVILERCFYFYTNRPAPVLLRERLLKHLHTGQWEDAVKLTETSNDPESRCMQRIGIAPLEDIGLTEQHLINGIHLELNQMERGLLILGTLGNNAPFIGLLGTVLGVIRAFHDLSVAGTGGPNVVMLGISEALVATAMGLFIAIPSVIAYNFFQRRIRKTRLQIEQLVAAILLCLKARKE
ncbi:MAG: MotA/TolQ/ExbB proton channel family protein [Nitrospirae bacterium]|nr:MotA/TolQ/ExbB proton channel family protein [Candidatus Troglogloeales bacterium]